jgi:hypothetical protein
LQRISRACTNRRIVGKLTLNAAKAIPLGGGTKAVFNLDWLGPFSSTD